jgi:serine/threonine-protein kinase
VSHILSCPNCAAVVVPQEAGTTCPQCRTPLPQAVIETMMAAQLDEMTRLEENPQSPPSDGSAGAQSAKVDRSKDRRSRDSRGITSSSGWLTSSGAIDHGRFEPGSFLGGRYRIIERLGRGGMGEVYRADDLKLGQPVALKFLPADVDHDPAKLTQLHTEVRMARQVSHPNVCRVYDIDEVDGQTFLSMEYVDGEDLSTLLRRVGRFPEDRALEIARQICAGLSAAHERDVIHRDLKPANVMIDGTGKVRITDFGLAGSSGEAIRAGTPAYMAPEQLSGSEVTERSDIYSLGLVLYELFTGQRALEGSNLAELIRKREQSGILPPSSIVKTIDPAIERAIMQCLRPEADARPASALAVAAALPGGDPLAAALAAGETPSPAMVAAAGSREALSARATIASAIWIAFAMIAIVLLYQRVILLNRVPLPKPPAALEDRAQETLAALGYGSRVVDTASGIGVSLDYARSIDATSKSSDRWNAIRTVRPETFFYWYRTSPRTLVPFGQENSITRTNPPLTLAGMTMVAVDATGRLSEFIAVPSPAQAAENPSPTDWGKLFTAAGLDLEKFSSTTPLIVPPVFADQRRAWEGTLPELPEQTVRIEAASAAGRPVYFGITGPWSRSARLVTAAPSIFTQVIGGLAAIIIPGLMVVGAGLARVNIKAGRGDRAGAFRVAAFVFILSLIAWLLGASHFTDLSIEINRIFAAIGRALFQAAVLWLAYLGLEPYVRRHSPDSILGWTKLVAGHWRDPRVGVDVMVGVCAGLAMTILYAAHNVLPVLAGQLEPMPIVSTPDVLKSLRYVFAGLTLQLASSVMQGMLAVAGVIAFVLLLKRTWLAVLAAAICFTPAVINGMFPGSTPRLDLAIGFGIITIFILTAVRAGLLSAVAALFTHFALLRAPITTDLSTWHATYTIWQVGVLAAIGFGACYIARYGQGERVRTS